MHALLKDALIQANNYLNDKKYNKAEKLLKSIHKQMPEDATTHYLLGKLYSITDHETTALIYLNQSIKIAPNYQAPYLILFNLYSKKQQPEKAIASLEQALKINNRDDELHITYLQYLYNNHFFSKGIAYAKTIQSHFSNNKFFLNIFGLLYRDIGDYVHAADYFNLALMIDPNYYEAIQNGVFIYKQTGQFYAAIPLLKKCISLNADFIPAYIDLTDLYLATKQLHNALENAKLAYKKAPKNPMLLASYMQVARYACDWHAVELLAPKLNHANKTAIKNKTLAPERPWLNVTRQQALQENYDIAHNAIEQYIVQRIKHHHCTFNFPKAKTEKIKVGFLSNDFFDHATTHLLGNFFSYLKHENLEIIAFSYAPENANDKYQKTIKKQVDYYIHLEEKDYINIAKHINQLKVDILIDMKGFTQGSKLEVTMLKPAPIMIQYLGYPGTMGTKHYDYIITDKTITPLSHAAYYAEKFIYLPDTYQVTDNLASISKQIYTKEMVGLPNAQIILASFNNGFKIEKRCFEIWLNLLKQHPNAILWLYEANDYIKQQLLSFAEKYNQTHQQIYFAENLPKPEHLARMQLADIMLDTFTCNGHTTTSDALWAGVPVITLQGQHFCSRVSASLLRAMNLPELITKNETDYQALISYYCAHATELQQLKAKVHKNRKTTALFDSQCYARYFRNALFQIYQRYIDNLPPEHIEIKNV